MAFSLNLHLFCGIPQAEVIGRRGTNDRTIVARRRECVGCRRTWLAGGREGFVEDSFEKATALCLRRGELHFELIAYRHQLVHFGDDSVVPAEKSVLVGIVDLAGAGEYASQRSCRSSSRSC